MGKSQTKRLREATKRFGREDWKRLVATKAKVGFLAMTRKAEAGLISPATATACPTCNGQVAIKRYRSCLSYLQNVETYGSPRK